MRSPFATTFPKHGPALLDQSRSRHIDRAFQILPLFLIVLVFIYLSRWGFRVDLSVDDLMNIWKARSQSVPELLADNILFFQFAQSYRPFGALFYHVMYSVFGFDILPYRAICFAALIGNLVLLYAVASRLSKSRETGAFTALLYATHFGFYPLYADIGTCFDIWCFTFFYGAMLYYIRLRQQDQLPGWRGTLVVCAFLVAGLNSKEMAVALPLILLAYELVHSTPARRDGPLARWLWREGRTVWITATICAAYFLGRHTGPNGISHAGGYDINISLASYLDVAANYMKQMAYMHAPVSRVTAFAVLASLWLTALLRRSRSLSLAASIVTLGILPVAFIHPRDMYSGYIPLVGCALYAAACLTNLRQQAVRAVAWVRGRRDASHQTGWVALRLSQAALFVAVAAFAGHKYLEVQKATPVAATFQNRAEEINSIIDQLERFRPLLGDGGSVLVLKDPFQGDEMKKWVTSFVAQILYPGIVWHNAYLLDPPPTAEQIAGYELVLSSDGLDLIQLDPETLDPILPGTARPERRR